MSNAPLMKPRGIRLNDEAYVYRSLMSRRTKRLIALLAVLVATMTAVYTVRSNNSERAHAAASVDYFAAWEEYNALPTLEANHTIVRACEALSLDCDELMDAASDLSEFPEIGRKDIGAMISSEVKSETKGLTDAADIHAKLTAALVSGEERALEKIKGFESTWRDVIFHEILNEARAVLAAAPNGVDTITLDKLVDEAGWMEDTASPLRDNDLANRLEEETDKVRAAIAAFEAGGGRAVASPGTVVPGHRPGSQTSPGTQPRTGPSDSVTAPAPEPKPAPAPATTTPAPVPSPTEPAKPPAPAPTTPPPPPSPVEPDPPAQPDPAQPEPEPPPGSGSSPTEPPKGN